MFLWDSFGLPQALPEPRPNDAMLPARISSQYGRLWQCILVAHAAARLDWNCNHAAFAKKERSGCWKISVGRRRFGEVELNRTSLYWGLLLICILSALVWVGSITFQTSELSKSGIAESLSFSILERFFVSRHVVWTQVLFSSYFFNWAAIPSIFLSSTNLCSFHGDRLAGCAEGQHIAAKKLGSNREQILQVLQRLFFEAETTWKTVKINRNAWETLGKPLEAVGWCGISSGFPAEKVSKDPRVPCPRCPIQGGKLSCGAARSRFCGMTYDLKWLMTTYIM